MINGFTANQMDDAVIVELVDLERRVEAAFNQFRPLLRNEPTADNRLREILRVSTDPLLRRDAWEAGKSVGPFVVADVLRLVALRNREARRLGYSDYYTMSLGLQEIEPDELFHLLDDIAAQTDEIYSRYKLRLDTEFAQRFAVTVDSLAPWHYGDPFFQEAPSGPLDLDQFFENADLAEVAVRFYKSLGLDVADILERSDLYEKPGMSQHAFCVHVGRYDDVRILCNCVPSAQWMGTILHECGHAVYDKFLGDSLPFFLREPSHIMTTEAIAMLFGRLPRDAGWLSKYAGIAASEAASVAHAAHSEQSAQLLVFTRWCLVMSYFERALYADPGQDLDALWWALVERYQGIRLPASGRQSLPDWAAKVHIAVSPVYYHNYLLGEMLASQLWDKLVDLTPNPEAAKGWEFGLAAGNYLRSAVFENGARLPWSALITSATGELLNPRHFVDHIG